MGIQDLPEQLLQSLIDKIACREQQIRQVAQLLCSSLPCPSLLVIHGVEATGKTLTVTSVLRASKIPSAVLPSRECITTRHLLERALAAVREALLQAGPEEDIPDTDGRCESISIFVLELQRLLRDRAKLILVFDGIDRQREATPTLLPALARLGEIIPNLTTVFILTTPHPHLLHYSGVPHLLFPPYTRSETLSLATASPLPISASPTKNSPDPTSVSADSDSSWLWTRFVAAGYDSLGQSAARDIVSFRQVCERLWGPFVQSILDGHYWPREFSKLMVKNRGLFQGETALVDNIVRVQPLAQVGAISNDSKVTHIKLPYYAAHLLIAAYLGSHNPARSDIPMLSKSAASKKRKKRGGATPNHTKNSLKTHRKISRRLLGPQPFGLERLWAIFHAIVADHRYRGGSAELMGQFATLVGLRLVVKAGAAGGGMGEALEGSGKWRCAVGWDFVRGVARSVGFVVEDYIVE